MPLENQIIPFAPPQRSDQGRPASPFGNDWVSGGVLGNVVLGLVPGTPDRQPHVQVNTQLRRGAVEGFVRTCERWRLRFPDQVILLGYRGNEFAAQPILLGRVRPSQDVLDRTGYILSISIGLASLYQESIEAEIGWLKRAHSSLAGAAPLDVMLDGKMLSMIRVHTLVMAERGL